MKPLCLTKGHRALLESRQDVASDIIVKETPCLGQTANGLGNWEVLINDGAKVLHQVDHQV